MAGYEVEFSFNAKFIGPKRVADFVLPDSLLQTAGATIEKERKASEVEVNG